MESEPTDGKDVQAEASAPISESQTEALDTEAELSKLTPELQAKFKQLLAQETKHLSERTDSTGSVKEPPPKQQKIEVDDDFQAFLSFLPEIDLEWGDLDPNVQQKLRYSQQAREDFKALHHQKQEINTYDPETGHITTTQPKKRPFEEQYKPPEIEAADKQLQQAMMQYHEHQVLPGLQHLTECCQNFYGTVSQEILLLQHMTDRHSLQLRSLEQSRCNKTILLKNLPPVGFTKTQLDRNVQYLLNDANLTWDRLAAMHNHVVTTDAAVLRLEFLTEEDAKIFFQAMKRRKHHGFFNGQQEAKQPVEDRLALQPFYALIDMLSPHFGNDGTNALQMDKNTLQVWPGSEHQDQTMLAQVSYHLDPHAPRRYLCTVLIREDVHHILVRDFHAKFQNRMKATLQLTQALTRATQDRTTTARHAWQKSFDISNTPNPLKAFPYQIHFVTISHDLIKLLETHPALPLQGTGGWTAVVAPAFADYGINVEDYGKGGSKGKSRPLQTPPQQAAPAAWHTKGKGSAKDKRPRQQNWQDRSPDQTWYPSDRRPDGNNDPQQDTYHAQRQTAKPQAGQPRQRPYQTTGKGKHKGKHRSLAEVILCKLCLCALGANRLCQQCWDNDLPSDFDQKQEIQSYPLYCPGKKGNSACNQLLGFGNCPLCIEHRNYWKSKAAQSVHPGFSPFQKAAHLVLDRALHDLDLVSADSEIKTDWLDDMRLAYDQDDQSGNYHFAEWVLMTYADLEGFENLLQSGRQPYCFPDWGAPGQLPSHGIYFGDKEQPLLMQTFWSAHYFGALLQKYYGQNWQRIVPGYTAEFFQAFDIRFAALLPWDYMVAASFRIALIQESEVRRDRSTEPIPGQWHMDNVEWLVQEVLEGIPRNQDVIDYVASKWAEIISEDDLLFDLFVGNQPYSNNVVRDLAAFATYYSDLMYWQFARMYSIALPKQTKAQVQCPNQQMHLLFDRIVQYLTVDDPQWVLQRGSNNKGNIIETLFLYLAEHGFHEIVIRTMWVILQHQARDGHYPWLVAVAR